MCRTVCTAHGTFHDNRTEPVVFQAVFRPWEGGSRHQLLGGVPFPHGYPPAPSPGARRMNADPWSAFRLSPESEPTARARAGGFSVRATPRTCTRSSCQRSRRRRAKWAARRSNPRLRLFRPLLNRLSYRPREVVVRQCLLLPNGQLPFRSHRGQPTKKPDVVCDTGF